MLEEPWKGRDQQVLFSAILPLLRVHRRAQCVLVVKSEIGMVVVGYFALAGQGPVGLDHHCFSVQTLVYSRNSISACSVDI